MLLHLFQLRIGMIQPCSLEGYEPKKAIRLHFFFQREYFQSLTEDSQLPALSAQDDRDGVLFALFVER
jgi:hypothetical protein